jgi:hypothetical protein
MLLRIGFGPKDRAVNNSSLEGWRPGFFSLEQFRELAPTLDPELSVGTREMTLDGLKRHVKLVGDLSVGLALGRQLDDPQLPRAQRFQTRAPLASRTGAGGFEFLAHANRQRSGATAGSEVERLSERLAR